MHACIYWSKKVNNSNIIAECKDTVIEQKNLIKKLNDTIEEVKATNEALNQTVAIMQSMQDGKSNFFVVRKTLIELIYRRKDFDWTWLI